MIKFLRTSVIILACIVLCGCSKEARKARFLERAQKDFAAGQFERAEIGYLNALRLDPADPVVIRQLGILYFDEGRLTEAYRFLRKTAETKAGDPDIELKLGVIYLTFHKPKEAREQAEKVLAKRTGDEEALLLLVETPASDQEIAEIKHRVAQLRQADKDKASYHLAFGALFLRQRDFAQAERELQNALALEPASGSAQVALGNLHWARNELAQAEKAFQTAAQTAPLRSPRRLKYAEFQMKNGKADAAKKTLQEITSQAPDYLPAWAFLIQIAFTEKKFDDCAALVTKVLSRDPSNYNALLYSANLKLARGKYTEGAAELEHLNVVYPNVPDLQFQLGRAYFFNEEISKAVKNLNLALAADPNFVPAMLLLAEIQIQQGNAASAIPQLAQLVKKQPQTYQAHTLLATAYLLQARTEEALGVYRELTVRFPKNPQPPLFLGLTFMRDGKRIEARKAFEKSMAITPDYLPALEQLVNLDVAEKGFASALSRVEKGLQKNPNNAELWLFMARVQLAQGRMPDAESSLQKSLALNDELRPAYTLLTQLYVELNRPTEALKKLTEISAKTNDVAVLMQIGMVQDQLKDFPAARDAYEKALALRPGFTPALNNLAYDYSERLGELDKALVSAEKARQLMPLDPVAADTLGWILFKKENYARALALLQECAGKLPENGEVQFHLGMTYYMLGEEILAQSALQKALQSKEEFSGKAEIPSRLAVLQINEANSDAAEVALLEKAVEKQPGDTIAATRLSAIYERKGDIKEAVRTCENVLKNNPLAAPIMARLAGLYAHHLNDVPKALELAKRARAAAPDNPAIFRMLGRLAYETGDYKWALSLVQEAAQKLPARPDLDYDLARCYYAIGNVSAAETAMRSAVQNGSSFDGIEDAKKFLSMVELYHRPAKIQTALPGITQILKSEPNYIPALMIYAVSFEQAGDYESAKKQYEKVLALNPLFAPAYRDLTSLYATHRINVSNIYDWAVKSRESFPDNPETAKALGILLYERKDYPRAAQLLGESSRKKNQDAEIFYYLGVANYNLKKQSECREALKRALALNLSAPLADEAKRMLATVQ